MATSELSWCTSQLNIILLGGRNSGKSSVGNFILGKEEFVTKERTSCSRRLGLVAGRWLTVVDTPGWWCDFSSQDTSELVKREIISSVSLCSPGPHVFLITIKASSAFSEKRRRAVEEHVGLLGEKVWSRCMVVVIRSDGCRRTKEEELVQTMGMALRWLTERCSRRCHTVTFGDDSEVTELLEKIEELAGENENGVFEMQEKILQAAAEEKRRVEERAQRRFMRMRKQRSLMRERPWPITDIRIVLVGAKGSGKTSTMNTILNRKQSSYRQRRTAQCQVGKGVVFGRQVTLVDTPGWWMNYFCDESPVFDRREMVFGLSLCPPGPHVFLLVIRVDRAFTQTYRRAVQEHLQLISEHIWSHVIVLFTFGDWLGGTTTEQCIESEGEPLQWLVERCGNRYHVLNNKTTGDGFQVRELIGKIEEMLVANGGQHYELERRAVAQMEGRMRREKESAKERVMKKEKQRQMARSQLEKLNPFPELRLVLVGGRQTGKSSCGNTILKSGCFDTETQTTSCSEQRANICGKTVAVLDTPGCFSVTSDLLLPSSALLLVVNVSSSFTDSHWRAMEKQLEEGGGQMWSRALVLFSHGDWLGDTSVEQRIESEGAPLQRLVEKCGHRYHVLDNKHHGDGAQVNELIQMIEEMLGEARLAVLHRGAHLWESVSSAGGRQTDAVTLHKRDLKVLMSRRHQLSNNLTESATAQTSLNCSDDGGQIVALPAGRPGRRRDSFMSRSASALTGKRCLRWTINLPVWFPPDDLHLRLNGESQVQLLSSRRPKKLLLFPQIQNLMLAGENVISVSSLCHPPLRERTLRRLSDSGGLQALIDQWGRNSLEELEAFIDSYFEMVWEETMGSCQATEPERPIAEQHAVVEESGQEGVLSSIDRKLSKLELLDEIRGDLAELRTSLEHSWKAIQTLREKSNRGDDDTC